jgi:hypothetical protein
MMEKINQINNNQGNFVEKFNEHPVMFLSEKSVISYEEVEKVRQESGAKLIYACDFNIEGIEQFEKDGYFQREKVVNLDHHGESPNYKRHISSTNLALKYIEEHPDFLDGTQTLAHHTDCDSILSSAMMSGIIDPDEKFGVAAIAADHTGVPNEIADLLQAIKDGPEGKTGEKSTPEYNKYKYIYALEQLQNLLKGEKIDEKALELYQKRLGERELLKNMLDEEKFKFVGENNEVAYLESGQEKFDATLLTGLFPSAKVIFTARKSSDGKTIVNVRLGSAVPDGSDIREIMTAIGEPFGGRWNAGANKRKGGSDSSAEQIAEKLVSYFAKSKRL